MTNINRVMLADSYKYSQPLQYPTNMSSMFDYMEARSSKVYPKLVWIGLQAKLKTYFSKPITEEEVNEAYLYTSAHGIPFEYDGWMYIVNELKGKLPIRIKAVPEGSVVPTGHVLMTVEATDPKVPWVVGWIETILMKLWYPCTVATKSYYVKKMLMEYAEQTQDTPFVDFQYHNFGDRGSTTVEAAAIGGMAHLSVGFQGTDNFAAVKYINELYGPCKFPAFSIPATEHSTITSWGKDGEFNAYLNYLETYKKYPIIACVMDSYNIFNAVNCITTGMFKNKIESEDYPIFVIRPDSGDPISVLNGVLYIMEDNFVRYKVNKKGYKVWDKYRIIWGDGITPEQIETILDYVVSRGYSSECIAFGSGGDLMQNCTRDTLGFAIKCSSITLEHVNKETGDKITSKRDVFKDPITDNGKVSKKGELMLYQDEKGRYITENISNKAAPNWIPVLETIYENGTFVKEYTFDKIRETVNETYTKRSI